MARSGSELVRIDREQRRIRGRGAAHPSIAWHMMGVQVPLIGDFHYNGHQLLADEPAARRRWPSTGSIRATSDSDARRTRQFSSIIETALRNRKPVRIGANWGSLDQTMVATLMDENHARANPWDAARVAREALIRSALDSAARAEELGMARDQIILSCKVSGVQELIAVYRDLAARCDYALHLGLTEAGMGSKGIVASTAALGVLLQEGIGDTIRISLTPEPGESRTREVIVAQELLQTMGLRAFTPMVTACPGCGRTTSTLFQELAQIGPGACPREDAGVANQVRRRREHDAGGHGLHRQRSRRIQACRHRHFAARERANRRRRRSSSTARRR